MALLGSTIVREVGLRLLPCSLGSNIVIRTACCTVGIALPVYNTFKAIEKKDHTEQEKWLVYWAAYGSFSLAEVLSDKILYWFPLYYHFKFAFLLWLQLPSNNGSRQLYGRHIQPFLSKHQDRLDHFLNSISREIVNFACAHQEEIQYLKVLLGKCAVTASQMVKGVLPGQPGGHNAIEAPRSPRSSHHDE